jgi:hypothetical protein
MTKRNPESGFALLFIYAMAAAIAISLFLELPRVAFEAQRDKEQLLIDRGEQYSRAVQLYVRKFNRYPADFDALDNTQNIRFLRNHYVDPMTGKDEWRLIHVGPGGVFTDSLVYNTKKKDGAASDPQNFITEVQQVGGNPTDPNQAVNLAGRVRPSDLAGAPGDPNNVQQPGVLQPGLNQPAFGQPGFGQAGVPQPPQPGPAQLGQPPVMQNNLIQPGAPQFDANGNIIPNTANGAFGPNPQPGFPQPVPNLPPGVQLPPNFPGAPQNNGAITGANVIGQLLTTARPGGLPSSGMMGQPSAPGGAAPQPNYNPVAGGATQLNNSPAAAATQQATQIIGGGIAGVASKREQEGIKVYREKSKYNEWEFVYDTTKDSSRATPGGAVPNGAQNGGQQQNGTQSPMQSPSQQMPPQPPMMPPGIMSK